MYCNVVLAYVGDCHCYGHQMYLKSRQYLHGRMGARLEVLHLRLHCQFRSCLTTSV